MIAADVTPKAVRWLFFPYIPMGKISVVAGQMGQAKSLFTIWLTSEITNGGLTLKAPGSVLMLSAEDDPEDTVRPRLEAAGADLARVWLEPNVALDMPHLARVCDELGDVRLITIDPIAAYFAGAVNSWKSQDVRQALEPLRKLAAERSIAILLVQHLNRRSDADTPLSRIADSQGIPQLARSVLVWGPDPSDLDGDHGSLKVLTRAKGNLARAGASATFTIAEHTTASGIKAPALTRGDDRQVAADDVVADADSRTAQDEAGDFLRALLADGPVDAKEVRRAARDAGISDRTLDRAKRRLKVRSEQAREGSAIKGWHWSSPTYTHGNLGDVGDVGDLDKNAKNAKNANSSKAAKPLPGETFEAWEARVEAEIARAA